MMEYVKISGKDNVAVAVKRLSAGWETECDGIQIRLSNDIPAGHKFSLREIDMNENIVKYGVPIGRAVQRIRKGEWVHTHNMRTCLDKKAACEYIPEKQEEHAVEEWSYEGYVRPDGKVGIRNEIWIIPAVGCVNDIAGRIAQESQRFDEENIDGIYAFTHPYGCSQTGEDHRRTLKIIAALASHPNAGGVVLVRLGCENITQEQLEEALGSYDQRRVQILTCQYEEDEITAGIRLVQKCAEYASSFCRRPVSAATLKIGLKCGGSDGMSGITANPVTGYVSDRIVAAGGTAILTETPEMFGAEKILAQRCINVNTYDKVMAMIERYKKYFIDHGEPVYENPSPGNKEGGISTLEEKSCGCVQKGGKMLVTDVLDYGDASVEPGVNLLYGPGNDLVSVTALAASGTQLILFTSGRGTPIGGPVPTVKISSNKKLAEKKAGWIDFNAGEILRDKNIEELGQRLFEMVLDVAGGRQTANEVNGYRSIAIWKDGVTL